MDYKSQLNIYCQKNKIPFPNYHYITSLQDGKIIFKSVCNFNNEVYTDTMFFNCKKDTDQNLAMFIINKINDTSKDILSESSLNRFEEESQIILIIDLDNQGNIKNYYNKLENYQVIAVGGVRTVLPEVIFPNHIIYKTDNTNKDAADIEIAFTVGRLLFQIKNKSVYVFSNDYALQTLCSILEKYNCKTTYFCNILDFIK